MVKDFLPDLADDELGWRAGYLGASFNVGQLFGAVVWGRLADTYGRRPCMLIGLAGTMASILMFGFSVNCELQYVVLGHISLTHYFFRSNGAGCPLVLGCFEWKCRHWK